eukprot:TRINITY_DN447_c0_g1_i2.p1 TRINITY_DN447_c0_g1~~TRINITY_DN447_c0_g1_i2.p1  ORF type:complete len:509 (+),score=114.61 TRINITY_DN447_c0_g1_i2:596-2122(+)
MGALLANFERDLQSQVEAAKKKEEQDELTRTFEEVARKTGDIEKNIARSGGIEAAYEQDGTPRLFVQGSKIRIQPGKAAKRELEIQVQGREEKITVDPYDARNHLGPFDMRALVAYHERQVENASQHAKEWVKDPLWHLRVEKTELVKQGRQVTIQMLEDERYKDLKEKEQEAKEAAEQESLKHKPPSTESLPPRIMRKPVQQEEYEDEVLPPGLAELFVPTFPIPHYINKPRTKKQHLLILKTAEYTRKHGFKAEIELKVKQANNKQFSFLFETGRLHQYYEFLKRGEHELSTRERFLKTWKAMESKMKQQSTGSGLSALGQYGPSSDESSSEEEGEKKTADQPKSNGNSAAKTASKQPKSPNHGPGTAPSKPRQIPKATETFEGHTPSSQVKQIVRKLALRVAHFGQVFEDKIRKQKKDDTKFAFLNSFNKYHSYYLWVLAKAREQMSNKNKPTKSEKSPQKASKPKKKEKEPAEQKSQPSPFGHKEKAKAATVFVVIRLPQALSQ